MANNYCAVPHAYLDECEALTDAEFGRLMRSLLRYSRDGEAIEPEGNERFFAKRMMNQEDMFNERYAVAQARRVAKAMHAANVRWHKDDGGEEQECHIPVNEERFARAMRMLEHARNASTEQNSTG